MKEMNDLAVKLVLNVMKSVSPDRIRPLDWWTRAQSALRSSAIRGKSFGDMVSIMGRKLLIDSFSQSSSSMIHSIGQEIEALGFDQFRDLCEREALYIVAEAQAIKSIHKGRGKKNEQSNR